MLALATFALLQLGATDPPPTPTAEETLALELVNRMRADPSGEARRLLADLPRAPFAGFEETMFLAEMDALEPAPPLVFHPSLIAAARNHAAYTVRHKVYGHEETPGLEGYTGENGSVRARFAGYPESHGNAWENAGSYLHGGVWGKHWGCAVDDGPGGPGGMQARRGHRATMMRPGAREFGTGFVFHPDGRCDAAALFGDGDGTRLLGGVCYFDLDGDRSYDVGEGVGHVTLRFARNVSAWSWESGAYALVAPEGGATIKWSAHYYDLQLRGELGPGTENAKIDVELAGPLRARRAELAEQSRRGTGSRRAKAIADLAFWTVAAPRIELDTPLPEEVVAAATAWREKRETVLAQIGSGTVDRSGEASPPPRDSLMSTWLADAGAISALATKCEELETWDGTARFPRRRLEALAAASASLADELASPDLATAVAEVEARIARLAAAHE